MVSLGVHARPVWQATVHGHPQGRGRRGFCAIRAEPVEIPEHDPQEVIATRALVSQRPWDHLWSPSCQSKIDEEFGVTIIQTVT